MNMGMKVVIGDATRPVGKGRKVLVHVCNDIGAWGPGFVKAVSTRWPEPERDYLAAFKAGELTLGSVRFVQVAPDLIVANAVARRGVRRTKGPPIRYEALREALTEVARYAQERHASVHMPRIGCGLAGGRWEKIEPILRAVLSSVSVTVYDLA